MSSLGSNCELVYNNDVENVGIVKQLSATPVAFGIYFASTTYLNHHYIWFPDVVLCHGVKTLIDGSNTSISITTYSPSSTGSSSFQVYNITSNTLGVYYSGTDIGHKNNLTYDRDNLTLKVSSPKYADGSRNYTTHIIVYAIY